MYIHRYLSAYVHNVFIERTRQTLFYNKKERKKQKEKKTLFYNTIIIKVSINLHYDTQTMTKTI
jgi:hypothetical protein